MDVTANGIKMFSVKKDTGFTLPMVDSLEMVLV